MRVSARFAVALLVLAGGAATLRLTLLRGARGEDLCASPGAIKATSLIPDTVALGERLEALDADVIQWSEGEVPNPVFHQLPMRFQIIRSYDAAELFMNPLAFGAQSDSGPQTRAAGAVPASTRRLQPEELRVRSESVDATSLPIHVAWDRTEAPRGPSRLVAWFFVFDNEPVRSPLSSQLVNALNLTSGGPRPLTLVVISALASEGTAGQVEDAAVAWLENAWKYVAKACAPK
jgi:hypothetical protein